MESVLKLLHLPVNEENGQQILTELSIIRSKINRAYFVSLDSKQIKFLYTFLWRTLDTIYKNGQPSVRIAASNTLGSILMKLGPYYYQNLMQSLQTVISSVTDESILLLSCFCYLSKFFNSQLIHQIISETPIFHLFGVNDSDHLVPLIEGLMHLPSDFLLTIAEFLFMLAQKYPNNRHFARASARLFSIDSSRFSAVLTDTTPLSIICLMYPRTIPSIAPEKREKLIERCFSAIKSENHGIEVDYACIVLNSLYKSGQVSADSIKELVTTDLVMKSSSIGPLLSLPIEEKIVKPLFTYNPTATTDVAKFLTDHSKVPILLKFFAKSKNYREELIFLLRSNIQPTNELFANALEVMPSIQDQKEIFNELLKNCMEIETDNWIHKFWIMKMLTRIDFSNVYMQNLSSILQFIENCSISKSDKLQKATKDTVLHMAKTMQPIFYRLFVDALIHRLDVFDQQTFEWRMSFLAFVFANIPEGYQESFLSIANFLHESLSLFYFTTRLLSSSFTILSTFINKLHNPEITLFFVKHATSIIDSSYHEFTGESISPPRTKFFEGVKHKNIVKMNDIDILQNPNIWHSQFFGVALAALTYLTNVPWVELDMTIEDTNYLFSLATSMTPFFPVHSSRFASSLLPCDFVTDRMITSFARVLTASVFGYESTISTIHFIVRAHEKCAYDLKNIKVDSYISDLKNHIRNQTYINKKDTDDIKKFFNLINILNAQKIEGTQNSENSDQNEKTTNYIDADELLSGKADKNLVVKEVEGVNQVVPNENNSERITDEIEVYPDPHNYRRFFSTITPFINANIPIPDFLKTPVYYLMYLQSVTIKPPKELLEEILDFSFKSNSKRLALEVCRMARSCKYTLDISKYVDHPLADQILSAFLMVIPKGFANNPEVVQKYVKRNTPDNFLEYCFQQSDGSRRKAMALIRFDPSHLLSLIEKLNKISKEHIYLMMTLVNKISFKGDEIFSTIFRIVSASRKSRKKRYLSLRLLSIFLKKYGKQSLASLPAALEIVKNTLDEAESPKSDKNEKGDTPEHQKDNSKENQSVILSELCLVMTILSFLSFDKPISQRLSQLVPITSPMGAFLSLTYSSVTAYKVWDHLDVILSSPLSSIRILPFNIATDILRSNHPSDISDDVIKKLLFVQPFVNTPSREMAITTFCDNLTRHLLQASKNPEGPAANGSGTVTSMNLRQVTHNSFKLVNREANMSPSADIAPLVGRFFKNIAMIVSSSSSKLDKILHYAESLFSFDFVDTYAIELFVQASIKADDAKTSSETMKKFIEKYGKYVISQLSATVAFSQGKDYDFDFYSKFLRYQSFFLVTAFILKVNNLEIEKILTDEVIYRLNLTEMQKKVLKMMRKKETKTAATIPAFYSKDDFDFELLQNVFGILLEEEKGEETVSVKERAIELPEEGNIEPTNEGKEEENSEEEIEENKEKSETKDEKSVEENKEQKSEEKEEKTAEEKVIVENKEEEIEEKVEEKSEENKEEIEEKVEEKSEEKVEKDEEKSVEENKEEKSEEKVEEKSEEKVEEKVEKVEEKSVEENREKKDDEKVEIQTEEKEEINEEVDAKEEETSYEYSYYEEDA